MIMEAIGAIGFNESNLNHNEVVKKFINQLGEETFGEFYDAIFGEVLDSELSEKVKEAEVETFRKHEAHEKAPLEECWKVTGRAPVGSEVGGHNGGKEKPEYRCSLVAKEIKQDKRGDLFAATPPLEAKKVLFSIFASLPGLCLNFIDVTRAYLHAKARRRVYVDLPEEDQQTGAHGTLKMATYGTRDAAQN